jgi:hypothetical protein
MIIFGMTIGSIAGGYMPTLLGANAFSLTSLFGSTAGGILGIWLAFKLSRQMSLHVITAPDFVRAIWYI